MKVNRYPIYIVSKGRWESRYTSKALEKMRVPYYIVVDAEEYDDYCSVIDEHKVLVMDKQAEIDYETCDDLGLSKPVGPGAKRNWCWQHAIGLGAKRHWVMDDNISSFMRLHNNFHHRVWTPAPFRALEDFVDRYENVAMAGFNYDFFCQSKLVHPPYRKNTRIYSCNLIDNAVPYKWRGRYNEDTILSLDMLKDNLCTIQFNAFNQEKAGTNIMKGGNTDAFYKDEGTLPKSQMLAEVHPDVAKVVWRYSRWHHHVNYNPFKSIPLIKKKDVTIPQGFNNYGMKLVSRVG